MTVLKAYLYRSIRDRAEKALEAVKSDIVSAQSIGDNADYTLEEGNLKMKVSHQGGRKSFDYELAEKFLKSKIPLPLFNNLFAKFVIEKIPGTEPPPVELMQELGKYFKINKEIEITQTFVESYDFPQVTREEIEANCYKEGKPFYKMTFPTKISDTELISTAGAKKVMDVVNELLVQS